MAQRNVTSNVDKTPLKIPEFKNYFLGKDPTDPYSREKFDPWSFEFTKTGQGGMKLATRTPGFDPEESTNGLEIIFLFESPYTQCRARNDITKVNRFCYSPDRKFSNRGYMCSDENRVSTCPFDKKRIDPKTGKPFTQNEGIRRPMKRTIFFLARRPNKGEEFKLVRYTVGLDVVDAFIALKDAVKAKMTAEWNLAQPIASAGTVLIYHKLERPKKEDQSVVVGRFDTSRFDLMQRLSDEELKAVISLQTELIQYNDMTVQGQHDRYEEKYLMNKRTGRLEPWVGMSAAAAEPAAPAEDHPDDDDSGDTDFNPAELTVGLTATENLPDPDER